MAIYTAVTAKHVPTPTANTVDTVTLTGGYINVEVLNEGTGKLYITTDGTTAPVVGANDTYLALAGQALALPLGSYNHGPGKNVVIKIISSDGTAYTVTGF